MREDKRCFVQFTHPGAEHRLNTGLNWNEGLHKRKFIKNKGAFLNENRTSEGDLLFWGEWEGPSYLHKELGDSKIVGGPRYIYEPYRVRPQNYRGLQNTDPFVFGDAFHYTCCRQFKKNSRGVFSSTQVRHLAPGSLILFGSCLDKQFVLDTVFVTGEDSFEYDGTSVEKKLQDQVSAPYMETTIYPLYPHLAQPTRENSDLQRTCSMPKDSIDGAPDLPFRLYKGVTYQQREQYGGMHSFFPCLPYEDNSRGFSRPVIRFSEKYRDLLTDNLAMGFKASECNQSTMVAIWNDVVRQVREQGLFLGIQTEIPK